MNRSAPISALARALAGIGARLRTTSATLVRFLDLRMDMLITLWIAGVFVLGSAKVLAAPLPPRGWVEGLAYLLPYLLIALAPIAGYRVAAGSFPRGTLLAQPALRLAWPWRWRQLDQIEARANPSYGPTGFMASLLLGLLLNVPLRTLEFLAGMPAIGFDAPGWAQAVFQAMTLDLIVMNFFYMVCFVMALRSVPLFPRMMAFAWAIDLAMQIAIARYVSTTGLPPAVAQALHAVLDDNVTKVLVSVLIWLPYLLLSERVNVTFRHRSSRD